MKQSEWHVALEVNAELGEGLHWDFERQRLWMVDIHGRRVMCWNPASPDWDEWAMPQRVGWVIDSFPACRLAVRGTGRRGRAPRRRIELNA